MWLVVKNLPANAGDTREEYLIPGLDQEDPLEESMAATPVFLPGESQGQRSLMDCCRWGRTELDTTEAT